MIGRGQSNFLTLFSDELRFDAVGTLGVTVVATQNLDCLVDWGLDDATG